MSKHVHYDEDEDYDEEENGSDDDADAEPTFRSKTMTKGRATKAAVVGTVDVDEDEGSDDGSDAGSDAGSDDGSGAGSDAGSEAGSMDEDLADEEHDHPTGSSRETGAPLRELASRFAADLDDDEDEEEEDDDPNYLQKFEEGLKTNIIDEFHPELRAHNYDEVDVLTQVVRNEAGTIIDPLHRTLPFLTKYEKARILGERAKQINSGAKPLVDVEPNIIDGYLIALSEFEQKKIPFIVKRPLPNGGCEYWKLRDLEVV